MSTSKEEFLKYRNELYGNYPSYREQNYQPQRKGRVEVMSLKSKTKKEKTNEQK